eukprot:6177218-Pleurochrysis_carterae.AAC.1
MLVCKTRRRHASGGLTVNIRQRHCSQLYNNLARSATDSFLLLGSFLRLLDRRTLPARVLNRRSARVLVVEAIALAVAATHHKLAPGNFVAGGTVLANDLATVHAAVRLHAVRREEGHFMLARPGVLVLWRGPCWKSPGELTFVTGVNAVETGVTCGSAAGGGIVVRVLDFAQGHECPA